MLAWQAEIKKNYKLADGSLGSGNFAVVRQATRLTPDGPMGMKKGDEVAIKIIDKAKVEDMNDIQVGTAPSNKNSATGLSRYLLPFISAGN